MQTIGADDLVVFVPLARDQDHVAPLRLPDCCFDGATSIGNHLVPDPCRLGRIKRLQHSRFHFPQDGHGILASRVVGGQDHQVALSRRRAAHLGSLASVTVPSTAEHRDDPAGLQRLCCAQ